MADVDLHMHTTRSDGRLTPTALVDLVASQGVKTFAVTDHDTTEGLAEAAEAVAKHPGLTLIDGVELSTDIEGSEVHILCYFVDKSDARFQSELARFREGRYARGKGMVEKLTALGMALSWERVLEIAGDASVGRPHVARALIEAGHVATNQEAFDKYIGRDGPAYVDREKLIPEEAIALGVSNGAVPVLAHPVYTKGVEDLLPSMKEAGLKGMEVYYGSYSPEDERRFKNLAEAHGLVPCGGSDYHGNYEGQRLPGAAGPPASSVEALRSMSRNAGG